jgi:beta,beta-carotene 9',10'-dioxygenase
MPTVAPAITPALGFSTLEREVVLDELALSGELPAWLCGSLLRTGPAKFEVGGQSMRHWFDGLAMLHRFTIDRGRVSYGSRFLESSDYRAAREHNRITLSEFATDPCRSLFKRVQTLFAPKRALADNANINIARLGERFVAMTETPLPVQFDPQTLAAADVRPFAAPGHLTTAHPQLDRSSGGMLNYAANLGGRSSYRFFALEPSQGSGPVRPLRMIASLPVKEPAYMHSFGLTKRWLVLAEFPFVVNPLALALSGRPYIENYRWKPELGTRFTLVDRASGKSVAGFRTDACFAFHHVNAYDDGEDVVVDLCALADAAIVEDLYLERLRMGKPIAGAELTRFRLRRSDRSVSRELLADGDVELPRINYMRCNERPYRYVWGLSKGASGWLEQIVKIDIAERSTLSWSAPACFAGEPVFVARPRDASDPAGERASSLQTEDDGVLLSVVLDADVGTSFLLVLDARDLSELARAQVPHHIPFGFHGQFARD